jgi:hypothetical protein
MINNETIFHVFDELSVPACCLLANCRRPGAGTCRDPRCWRCVNKPTLELRRSPLTRTKHTNSEYIHPWPSPPFQRQQIAVVEILKHAERNDSVGSIGRNMLLARRYAFADFEAILGDYHHHHDPTT